MENNEFKTFHIKNCMRYYFHDIIKLEDFELDNILVDEKPHENVLICDNSYETLIGPKPLQTEFDKIDRLIRIEDGTRYLTLFGSENYDAIYNRIRYFVSLKSSITYTFSHYFAKTKVDSCDSLPIEKRLTLHNLIILINLVFDKIKSLLLSDILEKYSYQIAK